MDGSIVQAHQHSTGAKKGSSPETGHSRGGASTKIHAVVDSYGYPVYIMISEGQRNDITYAIPLLEKINIKESQALADRGYDSIKLIDYIYDRDREPTMVEKLFLHHKSFRRITMRYEKLACIYLGFLYWFNPALVKIKLW